MLFCGVIEYNRNRCISMIRMLWENFLIRFFVDNLTLDKYWCCHQKSERSFFVRGRQFHICARCTGILTGYFISPVMCLVDSKTITIAFFTFTLLMAVDGFTQLWGLRESTNLLRFITGLGWGITFFPFCVVFALKIFYLVKECKIWHQSIKL